MNLKYIPLYLMAAATLGLAPKAHAQSELRKANQHFENYEYALAVEQYNKVITKRKPDLYLAQHIADSYRMMRQTQQAENWYGKIVNMEGRPSENLYFYAQALQSNGKYREAEEQYMKWGEEVPEKADRAQELIRESEMALQWKSKLPVAEVTPATALNSPNFADFSPAPFGNGIIFTSDRGAASADKGIYGWTGRPFLQLFSVEPSQNGQWGNPKPLQGLSEAAYHNATASATNNAQKLYFTRTQMVKRKGGNIDPTSWAKDAEDASHVNRLEIYSAEKINGAWANIQPFAYNNKEEYSVGNPALSADGSLMYFVSDMPGGYGDTDIYYSERKEDGTWGKPVNAGPKINTPGRESFPHVDKSGKLYFASNGHMGMGGLDIFEAEGARSSWSKVANMGYPINSSKDDFGIMFTEAKSTGLLSSSRDSNNGTEDIYSFKMLAKTVVLAITTLESKQGAQKKNMQVPLGNVEVSVSQPDQKATIVTSDDAGKYFMEARTGSEYTFVGAKQGYLKQSAKLEVPTIAADTVEVAMVFNRDDLNKAIVLDNIYYDLDKWAIRPDAARELDKLVQVLKDNPTIEIEMGSHTDSRESKGYNQKLSERRAKAAVDYLVSKGISRSRLTSKGYGKTQLVNGCTDGVECSEAEHQLNRRTEFKIKKK